MLCHVTDNFIWLDIVIPLDSQHMALYNTVMYTA